MKSHLLTWFAFFSLSVGCAQPPSAQLSATVPEVASWNGRGLSRGVLEQRLWERSGVDELRDMAIEEDLRGRLQQLEITVEQKDLDHVLQRLLQASGTSGSEAQQALAQWRKQRGLGQKRFTALLWREAALEKWISASLPDVTEEQVRHVYALHYGPATQVCVLVAASHTQARQWHAQVLDGSEMGLLATVWSQHESSFNEGQLVISHADNQWPAALRKWLTNAAEGSVSPVLPMGEGYVFVKVRQHIERESFPLEEVRSQMKNAARQQQIEQARFQYLGDWQGQGLLIHDPVLQRAWQQRLDMR